MVGPSCKGAVDLDAPVADNLKAIAQRLERDVEDLVVIVLDRPRHEKLIADIRAAGARIRLIGDGDLSAGFPPRWLEPACMRSWERAARRKACSPPRRYAA